MDEKRLYSRVPFKTRVTVKWENLEIPGRLIDLALKGALLEFLDPPGFKKGEEVELIIELPSSLEVMTFGCRVAHAEGNSAGLVILTADVESVTHLRRLLELNLGDPEQISRELSQWLD